MPRLVALIRKGGHAETGQPLRTPDELRRWLDEAAPEHVVSKPVLGSRGDGVLTLGDRAARRHEWHRVPGASIGVDGIVDHAFGGQREP